MNGITGPGTQRTPWDFSVIFLPSFGTLSLSLYFAITFTIIIIDCGGKCAERGNFNQFFMILSRGLSYLPFLEEALLKTPFQIFRQREYYHPFTGGSAYVRMHARHFRARKTPGRT